MSRLQLKNDEDQGLSTEKLNHTQQKQTRNHYKIHHNTKWIQKTIVRFGHLLQTPTWKRNGPILEEIDK